MPRYQTLLETYNRKDNDRQIRRAFEAIRGIWNRIIVLPACPALPEGDSSPVYQPAPARGGRGV
eukprot:CAMPEP_0204369094 /NCGR_PEP_ID=MMETSP0469-20131031/44695_1 /ASSEMBLY_ACC=CAM_ASM_000384 /TAXON_ID=2969 /ORGANISM="Oxyrrhis marina" /LENGTH=63 /DNA_ID=CAMNT_0051358763 /DNA_START=1 /DNA_END=189 /DNA_ORIENTATION=+